MLKDEDTLSCRREMSPANAIAVELSSVSEGSAFMKSTNYKKYSNKVACSGPVHTFFLIIVPNTVW